MAASAFAQQDERERETVGANSKWIVEAEFREAAFEILDRDDASPSSLRRRLSADSG